MKAHAKINLALLVGPTRPDGLHEVATVLQRVDLADDVELEPSDELRVDGFQGDTIVRRALQSLAVATGVAPCWRVTIEKRIPVAAGLGGGSSDAAAALQLANARLAEPLNLHELARDLGADVPFFLEPGPQLGTGEGADLEPVQLPLDYAVVLVLPAGETKRSTAAVYALYEGERGFAERRDQLVQALAMGDIAAFPPNDLVSSPLAAELRGLGAFRADVSGAGPTVYGLFRDRAEAEAAAAVIEARGHTWIVAPAW